MMSTLNFLIEMGPSYLKSDHIDDAFFATIGEHWKKSGWRLRKRVYLRDRESDRKLVVTPSRIRAAVERSFESNHASLMINLDKEDFKPMSVISRRGRKCKVCSSKPERGQDLCKECSELTEEEQGIVSRIDPVVVITVDTRWRWITGHVSLDAEFK